MEKNRFMFISYSHSGFTILKISPAAICSTKIIAVAAIYSQPILEKNHLTYVEKGTTVIDIVTPYFVPGLCVSALGALLAVLFTLRRALAQKREKQLEEREKKNETCIDNAPEHSE